jgi:hypothetical protein
MKANENCTVKCNWCGKLVLAAIAKYRSSSGVFYHRDCADERKEEDKRLRDELAHTS